MMFGKNRIKERSCLVADKGICDEINRIFISNIIPGRVNGILGFGDPFPAGDGRLPLSAILFRDYCPGLSRFRHASGRI